MKKTVRNIVLKNRLWLSITVVSIIGISASEVAKAYTMQYILDVAGTGSMEKFSQAVLYTVMVVAFMFVVDVFCDYSKNKFLSGCMITLKAQWFDSIQSKQLCDYDIQESSTYLSNFTVDVDMIKEDYLNNLLTIIEYAFTGLASLVVILNVHYIFIVFVVITFWIPLLINHLWSGRMAAAKLEASSANGRFTAALKELLNGYEVGKLYGCSNHMTGRFRRMNVAREKAYFTSRVVDDMAGTSSGAASLGIWMGTLLLGAFMVMRRVMSVGSILKVNQLLNNVTNPLYAISNRLTRMKAANQVYQTITERIEKGTFCGEGLPRGVSCETAERPYEVLPGIEQEQLTKFRNHVEIRQLSLEKMGRKILKDMTITFERNQKYLLLGESGSGKSSLLKVLLNIYGNYDGEIMIDGKEFRKLDKDSWYRQMAFVSQDNFVFQDTVRNNILLYQEYTEEQLKKAVELSCLAEFLENHREGLDFVIEENGKNISGGERQRICLARALIRKPPVLILDEATSALNSEMALQVEKNILTLENTMVISVSHRIHRETYEEYDKVLQFDSGSVKQRDGGYIL
ncbi:ABC transporter ATP-binding protein [Roseburia hominis]